MIPPLSHLLMGFRILSVEAAYAAPLLELCRRHTIPYDDFTNGRDGEITLRFTRPAARRVETICKAYGIPLTLRGEGGLPRLLHRLGHRPGLLVGCILGLGLYLAASGIFWDIRISGNTTLSDRTLRESLEDCGLSVGTPLRGFEADVTENRILLLDDRLAWVSINRKGTVAYVEVREAVKTPEAEDTHPRDMVAARDGVIEYVELEAGNVRVKAGQTVHRGQVLVSGIYDSQQTGIRVEAARARVFARTTRVFSVEIPLSYEEKRYLTAENGTGQTGYTEKSLIFFGRHIKFSKKYGNLVGFCDIMEDEKSWGLASGVGFPISTRTLRYLPYETITSTRSYAEAEELAYFELAGYLAALPGGATLLSKTVTLHHGRESLTLTCTLTVIEDIAAERVIEIQS